MDNPPKTDPSLLDGDPPKYHPRERFWPYVSLPEEISDAELAAIDPDLHAALYGTPPRPFSITVVFPPFESPDFPRALELARSSAEYRQTGSGEGLRHRARFWPADAVKLRDLFEIVGRCGSCEVLVDDRPVPYARELWLPLILVSHSPIARAPQPNELDCELEMLEIELRKLEGEYTLRARASAARKEERRMWGVRPNRRRGRGEEPPHPDGRGGQCGGLRPW